MVKSKKDEIYTIVIHEVEKLPETNEAQGRGSNTPIISVIQIYQDGIPLGVTVR